MDARGGDPGAAARGGGGASRALGGGRRRLRGGAGVRPCTPGRSRGWAAPPVRPARRPARRSARPGSRCPPLRPRPRREPGPPRRGRGGDPRGHRGGWGVPGELHAPAARAARGRPALALPAAPPGPGRRRDGLPPVRQPGGRLGLARALPAPEGKPGHVPAHEGNGAAGALGRRGRGGGPAARGLGEGPRRERDDRRPPPQRPGPGRGARHRPRRSALRGRAVSHGVAAHLHRLGPPPSGEPGSPSSSRPRFPAGR